MSKLIRVLHILQRMEAGGTQALLMNIYRKIDRTKVQFDFLVIYEEKQFYDNEIELLGGHLYKMSFRENLNLFKFEKELRCFFKEHCEYKIVHCHAYTFGYFCLKAAKRSGIKVRIAHSHSNAMTKDFKMPLKLVMQKMFLVYANDYFACSNEAGRFLFKNRKFKVLNNAIDSSKYIYNYNTAYKIKKEYSLLESFVVGHVGRFKIEKNHVFLLGVFKYIKMKKKNAKLLLIGSGDEEENIRRLINSLGLKENVIFIGNIPNVNEFLQAMDIFIFPSKYEGLGIVAIEAQAAGVPVITSTGVPEDVEISPIIIRKPLTLGEEKWADYALEISHHRLAHKNTQNYILESGYDLSSTVNYIQEYYLNACANINEWGK